MFWYLFLGSCLNGSLGVPGRQSVQPVSGQLQMFVGAQWLLRGVGSDSDVNLWPCVLSSVSLNMCFESRDDQTRRTLCSYYHYASYYLVYSVVLA